MNLGNFSSLVGALALTAAFALGVHTEVLAQPADSPAPFNSEALLIVYPDYPINTDTWYGTAENAGHAGVLLIRSDGLTKYFEFGRYPPGMGGRIRTVAVPNVIINSSGKATPESLKAVLAILSASSGKNTRIRAAYFIDMDFILMEAKAKLATATYSITSNNCAHYAEGVIVAGNPRVDRPTIINFLPNNIVDEYLEEKNAEILYDPTSNEITIGQGDESDAKE